MVSQNRISLAFGGDVTLARRQHILLATAVEDSGRSQASFHLPSLRDADLSMVNLECVISDLGAQGVDKGEGGPYYFRARPEMTGVLTQLGVDIVVTANNHSGDYGPEALLDQMRWLEVAGVGHVGSGRDREAAFTPRYLTKNGLKLAVFAVDATQEEFAADTSCPGNAYLPINQPEMWRREMTRRIAAAREIADLVVVAVHWGPNLKHTPGPKQLAVGQMLIQSGADLVLGTSSHVLQGIEIFDGRPIVHDAGNLLCDFAEGGSDGAIFRFALSRDGVTSVEVVPVRVAPGSAYEAEGDVAAGIAQRFAQKCAALGTHMQSCDDHRLRLALHPPQRPPNTTQRDRLRQRFASTPIPEDACITPVALGPLMLHAVRFGPPRLTERNMVWVETWWSADHPVADRLLIALHGMPQIAGPSQIWGAGAAHEPCDWQLPTTDWEPGQIYYERFGLRPPPRSRLVGCVLDLEISVIKAGKRLARMRPQRSIVLDFDSARNAAQAAPIPTAPAADAVLAAAWSAGDIAHLTGGRWLNGPAADWRCGSVVAGAAHIPLVPGPVLFAAHSHHDRNRHESRRSPTTMSWDSHRTLPKHAGQLCGAIVRQAPAGIAADFPLLQVEDPLAALMQIGEAARIRMRGKVICVTGSSGKTSTVGMLQTALAPLINCRSTYDNYNTRVGLLVNLASAQPDTEAFVLEAAMSAINSAGQSHIRRVNPDIAIITNIAAAHLDAGETTRDIARKKANIFLGMQPGRIALLWRDCEQFDYLSSRAREAGLQLMTWGEADGADFQLVSYDPTQRLVKANTPQGQLSYRLGANGRHMAMNSVAALAVASLLSLDLSTFAEGLGRFSSLPGRGETRQINAGAKSFWLQDESYNANPLSMTAALQSFGETFVAAEQRLIILGDMAELGTHSEVMHRSLLPAIIAARPERIMLVGEHMPTLAAPLRAAGIKVDTANDVSAVTRYLNEYTTASSALLIKASNSVGLWKLVTHLRAEASDPVSTLD